MTSRFTIGFACALLLSGCSTARMQLPTTLSAVEAWQVTGANPRTWNRPLAFGPWETARVEERSTFSWGFEALGVTVTGARRPYELTVRGPSGAGRDVACLTREITLGRGTLAAEVTGIVAPRLLCTIHGDGSTPASLLIGRHGGGLRGTLRTASASYSIESVHRLAGSRIPTGDPAGYEIVGDGSVAAAVEVVNRGRVWIAAPGGDQAPTLAAAAAALLLFDPEIGPES